MIAAAAHGIETEADPGDPVREDIYEFDDDETPGVRHRDATAEPRRRRRGAGD